MPRTSNQVTLPDSGVIPGTYSSANIVVDRKGIIISATDGAGGGGGAPAALNDLTDVIITSAVNGEVLQFQSGIWRNEAITLDTATDVNLSSPGNGDILQYNGAEWVNADLSTAGFLTSSDIGVSVQGYDPTLAALAGLNAGTGFVVQTGVDTFAKRTLTIVPNSGLVLNNPGGVAANPELDFDILTIVTETNIDRANDFMIFHDDSINNSRKASISDIVSAGAPIASVINVGSGVGVFARINANREVELRQIQGSPNISVNNVADTIQLTLTGNAADLANLTPGTDTFIVGNGTNWITQTGAGARTALGLGSMAVRSEDEFLELTGDTMSGDIDMDSNRIVNVPTPVSPGDAVNKQYVDDELADLDAGAGMIRSTNGFDIQNVDGSITINTDDIQLNTAFTDARYYTQTELGSMTDGTEGADLVGTDNKPNLGSATTVEEALEFLDQNFSTAPAYAQDITGVWNLDVGAPTPIVDTVRDIEVTRFQPNDDVAIYKDLLLPPFFDQTKEIRLVISVAKETVTPTSEMVVMALAYQHQRPAGVAPFPPAPTRGPAPFMDFTADDTVIFNPDHIRIETIEFTIPANVFLPLDTITLRLSRLGLSDLQDTHTTGLDFFAAYIYQPV